jgi:hypothetical protein
VALTRAFCHTSQCKRLKLKSQKEALLLFLHATSRDGVCAMKSIVTIVRLRCHLHVIQRGRDTAALYLLFLHLSRVLAIACA